MVSEQIDAVVTHDNLITACCKDIISSSGAASKTIYLRDMTDGIV